MSGHTPGPWSLWGRADPSQVIASESGFVAQTVGGNDEANARLIAAAPDMLEVLKAIRHAEWRDWEELASPEEFVRWAKSRANHAIAKATGGAE